MTRVHGVTGHLLSGTFIAEAVVGPPMTMDEEAAHRDFIRWHAGCAALGPATSPRALLNSATPLLAQLGFAPPASVVIGDELATATVRAEGASVCTIAIPWGGSLNSFWAAAVSEAHRRAAGWSLLFDGRSLRLVDATRLYARRALEFDLDIAADRAQTFLVLWRTARAAHLAVAAEAPGSLRGLVAASERHAAGVCRSLRNGVLDASTAILRALAARRRTGSLDAALDQALTIVYRILFLLFAEARALVPLWHPIYRESYSIEALRDAAERSTGAEGMWDALRAIGRLAHAGCRAGDLRVTPFNGRLFAPGRTPLADRRDLDDRSAQKAVMALSTRPAGDRAGRERVAYRDLGVEQLGAVYETLLDYQPRIDNGVATLVRGSGVRKETGTFYTPRPIAEYLVRRTLEPLVRDAEPARILQLRVVDPAMGSGAFLVAASRFLAGAYEAALIRTGACHPTDITEGDRALFRRTVAERCLYGVDLNPMAVQLARLSLWLATLAADRPLSFLDHRLQTGDSLLGTWLRLLRRPPTRRRRPGAATLPLFDANAVQSALRDALPVRFSLEATPNDTLEQVREKERAFHALTCESAALTRWKRIAHVWCSAWFAPESDAPPSAFGSLSDAVLSGKSALPAAATRRYLEAADRIAAARRLFHWELEFPEVFFEADGSRRTRAGFDAVIGNPPWDMIRADAGGVESRSRARAAITPALRFTRDSGVYAAQSTGHANRYQLFVERAVALTRDGGRLGLVLPSGLATDHGSVALRRLLLTRCDVDGIVGMDNHKGVFPIHRSVRFVLVTATAGSPTDRIQCRLGIDDPAVLESIGNGSAGTAAAMVDLSLATLQRISGDALTIPHVRAPIDLSIAERAASLFPPLGSERGWNARFGRELNATEDRQAFRCDRRGLPVVEGKHLGPFHVALGRVRQSVTAAEARRLLRSDRYQRPRLAYRDVAGATNRLTLIAAVLPAGCVSTHTVFCLRTVLPRRAHDFLCGVFNSFVANYLVRLRVTTHVTTAAVEQLPVPTADAAPAAAAEIAALARLLARRHSAEAFARLNACVARLYQLNAAEFEHILQTFPLVDDDVRARCFEAFQHDDQSRPWRR